MSLHLPDQKPSSPLSRGKEASLTAQINRKQSWTPKEHSRGSICRKRARSTPHRNYDNAGESTDSFRARKSSLDVPDSSTDPVLILTEFSPKRKFTRPSSGSKVIRKTNILREYLSESSPRSSSYSEMGVVEVSHQMNSRFDSSHRDFLRWNGVSDTNFGSYDVWSSLPEFFQLSKEQLSMLPPNLVMPANFRSGFSDAMSDSAHLSPLFGRPVAQRCAYPSHHPPVRGGGFCPSRPRFNDRRLDTSPSSGSHGQNFFYPAPGPVGIDNECRFSTNRRQEECAYESKDSSDYHSWCENIFPVEEAFDLNDEIPLKTSRKRFFSDVYDSRQLTNNLKSYEISAFRAKSLRDQDQRSKSLDDECQIIATKLATNWKNDSFEKNNPKLRKYVEEESGALKQNLFSHCHPIVATVKPFSSTCSPVADTKKSKEALERLKENVNEDFFQNSLSPNRETMQDETKKFQSSLKQESSNGIESEEEIKTFAIGEGLTFDEGLWNEDTNEEFNEKSMKNEFIDDLCTTPNREQEISEEPTRSIITSPTGVRCPTHNHSTVASDPSADEEFRELPVKYNHKYYLSSPVSSAKSCTILEISSDSGSLGKLLRPTREGRYQGADSPITVPEVDPQDYCLIDNNFSRQEKFDSVEEYMSSRMGSHFLYDKSSRSEKWSDSSDESYSSDQEDSRRCISPRNDVEIVVTDDSFSDNENDIFDVNYTEVISDDCCSAFDFENESVFDKSRPEFVSQALDHLTEVNNVLNDLVLRVCDEEAQLFKYLQPEISVRIPCQSAEDIEEDALLVLSDLLNSVDGSLCLTPALEVTYAEWFKVLGNGHPEESLVTNKELDINITRASLVTLVGEVEVKRLTSKSHINDEIINGYMALLKHRSSINGSLPKVFVFNTFFYESLRQGGHARVKRWTKNYDLFQYDMIVIPLNFKQERHWGLFVIDLAAKLFVFYDSMNATDAKKFKLLKLSKNVKLTNLFKEYLSKEHSLKKSSFNLDLSLFSNEFCFDGPQQRNLIDCGVFCMRFAEAYTRRGRIDFCQAEMIHYRKQIFLEIIYLSIF